MFSLSALKPLRWVRMRGAVGIKGTGSWSRPGRRWESEEYARGWLQRGGMKCGTQSLGNWGRFYCTSKYLPLQVGDSTNIINILLLVWTQRLTGIKDSPTGVPIYYYGPVMPQFDQSEKSLTEELVEVKRGVAELNSVLKELDRKSVEVMEGVKRLRRELVEMNGRLEKLFKLVEKVQYVG